MNNFNPERQIAIIWSIEDVKSIRPDLSDDECMEVLGMVQNKHDASLGVTWDTLDFWAYYLYPISNE
jgi:hypothetical protein